MTKTKFNENYFKLCEFAIDNAILKNQLSNESDFFKRNLILANIPKKYWKFKWKKIREDLAQNDVNSEGINTINEYLVSLDHNLSNGTGLYICGGHGTSKTTTAIIILRRVIKKKFTGFYLHSSDLLDYVINGYKDEVKRMYWEYIIKEIQFLVIDDIARNFKMTEKEQLIFDKLFIYRSNNCLPTIFTTNLDKDNLKDKVGEALISLFSENLKDVVFVGKDIRRRF